MSINKEIQEKGASLKKEILSEKWITSDKSVKERIDNDYTVYIYNDYIYRDKIITTLTNGQICFELLGKKTYKTIESIDSLDSSTKNSKGLQKDSSANHNKIASDDVVNTTTNFCKITPENKKSNNPKIQPNIPTRNNNLFTMLPLNSSYTWHFTTILPSLIEELDKLSLDNNQNIIACCLRPIFELCAYELKSRTNSPILKNANTAEIIEKIINRLNNKNACQIIANSTGFSFNDLKNIINKQDFSENYSKSNLSAHKASQFLTRSQIEEIIKYASFFMVFTNELLGNEEFKKIIKLEE